MNNENSSNTTANTAENNQQQTNQQQTINKNESAQAQLNPDRVIELSKVIGADKLKVIQPYITSYIEQDKKEQETKDVKISELEKKCKSLEAEVGKINDITMIAQHGLDTNEYDVINKWCDYNITTEKLEQMKHNEKYFHFLRKREAQKSQITTEVDVKLFSDLIRQNKGF